MNLLQYQINPILHTLSHSLESPIDIMAHQASSDNEVEVHGHSEHRTLETLHEHALIDFIASIFEARNHENGAEETLLVESKVDKHITKDQGLKKIFFTHRSPKSFLAKTQKSARGHAGVRPKPPQSS